MPFLLGALVVIVFYRSIAMHDGVCLTGHTADGMVVSEKFTHTHAHIHAHQHTQINTVTHSHTKYCSQCTLTSSTENDSYL